MALVTVAGPVETVQDGPDHVQGMRLKTADGQNEVPADPTFGIGVDLKTVRGVATATVAQVVAATTNSTQLVAGNSNRQMLLIFNNTPNDLRIKFGTGAAVNSFTSIVPPYTEWFMPPGPRPYTGVVHGKWEATDADGAHVTEY